MRANRWRKNDGYQYILACTKEDVLEIISVFGPQAEGPTKRMEGVEYSFYLLNIKDRIITPYRSLFFGYIDDPDSFLVGERCTVALFLDSYRLKEYPNRRCPLCNEPIALGDTFCPKCFHKIASGSINGYDMNGALFDDDFVIVNDFVLRSQRSFQKVDNSKVVETGFETYYKMAEHIVFHRTWDSNGEKIDALLLPDDVRFHYQLFAYVAQERPSWLTD